MQYLITGGAGFIGSHLAEHLIAQGHGVVVVDDLSTGSRANLDALAKSDGLRVVEADVAAPGVLEELMDQVEAVFHLAAAVGVQLIVQRPVHTIETNIHGTEQVLRLAAKRGQRVLITSTSEVYGKSPHVPFREDDDMVLGPTSKARWSYACSKAIDEFLALSYWREQQLPTTVVRLFNTVGPRQVGRYGMVIPRFVDQALGGGPICVYGDGEQTRCFCDVSDVVSAMARLMACDEARGQVFNLGSDEEVSINELAVRIRARIDPGLEIRHVPYSEAYEEGFEDLRRRVPDISRARKRIDFKPSRDLDAILDRIIAWRRLQPPEARS